MYPQVRGHGDERSREVEVVTTSTADGSIGDRQLNIDLKFVPCQSVPSLVLCPSLRRSGPVSSGTDTVHFSRSVYATPVAT